MPTMGIKSATATDISFGPAPDYVPSFVQSHRVHIRGHIWLNDDQVDVAIPFRLLGGFTFKSNGTDGTAAMFTGIDKDTLDHFDSLAGLLWPVPTLSNNNKTLTMYLHAADHHEIYYYLFNIVTPDGMFEFPISDPIIVNR